MVPQGLVRERQELVSPFFGRGNKLLEQALLQFSILDVSAILFGEPARDERKDVLRECSKDVVGLAGTGGLALEVEFYFRPLEPGDGVGNTEGRELYVSGGCSDEGDGSGVELAGTVSRHGGRARGGSPEGALSKPKRSKGNAALSSLKETLECHSGVTNVPVGTSSNL